MRDRDDTNQSFSKVVFENGWLSTVMKQVRIEAAALDKFNAMTLEEKEEWVKGPTKQQVHKVIEDYG